MPVMDPADIFLYHSYSFPGTKGNLSLADCPQQKTQRQKYHTQENKNTEKMERLIERLEELDDVSNIYHNWEEE